MSMCRFANIKYLMFLSLRQICKSKLPHVCSECNGHSYDEDAASDTAEEMSAANCKCGSFKEFCAAKDCVSMFCPESTAVDETHFQQCSCCNKAHCASHMDCIKICCQCHETLCYERFWCGICEETLCESCCSGIHEEECMMKHASPGEPLSEAELRILFSHGRGIWGGLLRLLLKHGDVVVPTSRTWHWTASWPRECKTICASGKATQVHQIFCLLDCSAVELQFADWLSGCVLVAVRRRHHICIKHGKRNSGCMKYCCSG